MKKISIILFLLIAFNVLNAAVHGDVNGDGAVNAADVTAIYDVLLGVDNSLESSADVNSDDAVTSADVTDAIHFTPKKRVLPDAWQDSFLP